MRQLGPVSAVTCVLCVELSQSMNRPECSGVWLPRSQSSRILGMLNPRRYRAGRRRLHRLAESFGSKELAELRRNRPPCAVDHFLEVSLRGPAQLAGDPVHSPDDSRRIARTATHD